MLLLIGKAKSKTAEVFLNAKFKKMILAATCEVQ